MADKPRTTLTDAELRIMLVLWDREEATVGDVVATIKAPKLARNTVMTTLGILERKGYAAHRVDGRTFVYRARVGRVEVQHKVLASIVTRFFGGSHEELVTRLVDSDDISPKDAKRIKGLLGAREPRK